MCTGSVGSGLAPAQTPRWPKSQSLFFSLAILFSLLKCSLFPLPNNEDISSCKQRMKETTASLEEYVREELRNASDEV